MADIPEGTVKPKLAGVVWYSCKNGKVGNRELFGTTRAESDGIAIAYQMSKNYDELLQRLDYFITEQNVVKYYRDSGLKYEDFKPKY